jgi:CheY-like chemotaxis protein
VFLDLQLPTLTGLQLLEAIRADDRIKDVPVIVMTSSNDPADLDRCRELGVFSFVQKPLTFASFAKAFADTFHARREVAQLVSTVE